MLLCQHLGWDLWGKKVCRGRRGSARAERVEAQRLIFRLPDTARWLLMNGQREEATALLRRVEPDMDPEEEVQRIEHDLSYEEKGTFAELCQGRFRKAGIFVVGLGFLVQIPGLLAFVYYSPRSTRGRRTRPGRDTHLLGPIAGVIAEDISHLVWKGRESDAPDRRPRSEEQACLSGHEECDHHAPTVEEADSRPIRSPEVEVRENKMRRAGCKETGYDGYPPKAGKGKPRSVAGGGRTGTGIRENLEKLGAIDHSTMPETNLRPRKHTHLLDNGGL